MLQQFNRHSRMPLLSEYEQQDEPVSLQELLGRFKEYEFVPGLFAQILGPPPSKESAPVKTIPDKIFDANKSWTKTTKLRLWIGQDKIPLDNFYAVRDGNPTNESASSRDTVSLLSGVCIDTSIES